MNRLWAEDKLQEAEFFLKHLKLCNPVNEMRYYFSAFCSACRSVTFALQKEGSNLLDKQSFDEWYKNEQIRLGAIPTAKMFVNFRNVTQKEGNRLPLLRFEGIDENENQVIIDWDLSKQEDGMVKLEFDNRTISQGFDVTSSDEIETLLMVELEAMIQVIPELIGKMELKKYKWVIDDKGQTISTEEFIPTCESYLIELKTTMRNFKNRFENQILKL